MNRSLPISLLFFTVISCSTKKAPDTVATLDSVVVSENEKPAAVAELYSESNPGAWPVSMTFLGFSPDLKYAAFDVFTSTEAVSDGIRYVIVVDKNDYATKPMTVIEGEDGVENVKEALNERGMTSLQRFEINGTNLGTRILLDSTNRDQDLSINNQSYGLRLIQLNAPNGGKMFELHLIHEAEINVLQKDRRRPDSRGPIANYYLKEAWVKGNKIVVIVITESEPFAVEGGAFYMGRQYMAVTGKIN